MKVLERVQAAPLGLATPITARQVLLVSLLLLAVFTRFWRLGTPDEIYFDEVHFIENGAQKIFQGDPAAWAFFGSENTHPPLSKLFMAGGIAVFGEESSFGWRFFGALAGVGSVIFIYLLGRRLFKSEAVGMIAAFLMTFEGLMFAQSRIATPDTYVLFFVLGSIYFLVSDRFLLSGIFFGAALATKLTALLTVFPIVIYLLYRYWQTKPEGEARLLYLAPLSLLGFYLGTPVLFGGLLVDEVQPGVLEPGVSAPVFSAALGWWMALLALAPVAIYLIYRLLRSGRGAEQIPLASSLAMLPLFFVVMPLYVYLLTYLPMLLNGNSLGDVFELNRAAYQFHSTLDATHPYQAPWDTWPIMMRPVFFFLGSSGEKIYNLGNPTIFWFGLPALGFVLWRGLRGVQARLDAKTGDVTLWGSIGPGEAALLFVVLTYLGFWLPWAIQPRIMFIYHYLPSLAFLILALAYTVHRLWQQSWGRIGAVAFLAAVAITFAYFYPHLAAWSVSSQWDDSLFWFNSWR